MDDLGKGAQEIFDLINRSPRFTEFVDFLNKTILQMTLWSVENLIPSTNIPGEELAFKSGQSAKLDGLGK